MKTSAKFRSKLAAALWAAAVLPGSLELAAAAEVAADAAPTPQDCLRLAAAE